MVLMRPRQGHVDHYIFQLLILTIFCVDLFDNHFWRLIFIFTPRVLVFQDVAHVLVHTDLLCLR